MSERTNTIPPTTLQQALKAAHAQGLEPWTSENSRWIGLQCPTCRTLGTTATCTIEELAGILKVSCNGCHDNIEPGILNLLGTTNPVTPGAPETNGAHPTHTIGAQTWRDFETTAGNDIPCLIKDLWPEGALGFIGAAPKAGKTWIGLDIAISIATGTPVFGSFPVPTAHPVLYVALEGHRAAIRTRIGCIARGHGHQPEDTGLDNLHLAYKPRGINLTDPAWATALCDEAIHLGVKLVIVDVLRRAATIKENDATSFMELVSMLNPISDQNISVGMLHHFNKTNENTTLRTPAERMAGSGAMFGAFDVGLFITKSENGARKLEIHTDIRDLAAPDKFIITLNGDGTGAYGGFTYKDTLRLVREDAPAPQVKGAPLAIRSFIIENDGSATPKQIRDHFGISEGTLKDRRDDLETIGVHYLSEGARSRYEVSYALPRSTPQNDDYGVPETGYPAQQNSIDCGVDCGAPRTPHHYVDAGGAGSQAANSDYGVDEVQLDQDDDAGYWDMLNAINDPEAKEHE